MTLLTVVRDVCATVGVMMPSSVFSNITGNRTMQEMLALANEMAQRIAYDGHEWTALKDTATFTGDGELTLFPLPSSFKRTLLTSQMWKTGSPQQSMRFIPDFDEFKQHVAMDTIDTRGEWMIHGSHVHIAPTLDGGILPWAIGTDYSVGNTVRDPDTTLWTCLVYHTSGGGTFAADRAANPTYWASTPKTSAYLSFLNNKIIQLASGGQGDTFSNDGDTFLLGERLLKLGMIWQWKAQKGSAFGEDLGTYGDALAFATGKEKPAPIYIDRMPISAAAKTSYPWPTP